MLTSDTFKKAINAERLTVKARLGYHLNDAISDSIELAETLGCLVTLEFNDKKISCEPWDKVEDKYAEYMAG